MSIEIIQQTDYNDNLQYVLEQYKYSDNMIGMVKAFNAQMSEVESALFEIRDEYYLDTAEGVQLDTIGTIFSEPRRGRADAEYRLAIQQKGASFFSGTPEDIISQMITIYGATFARYRGPESVGHPASCIIVNGSSTVTTADLEKMSPAGVLPFDGKYLITNSGKNLVTNSGKKIIVKRR